MTKEQFREWIAHHQAAFPGIASWLAKIDKAADSPTDLRSAAILGSWFRVLADVELIDAKAATDAMAKGDIDEPRSYDGHAKAVRKAGKTRTFDRGRQQQRSGPQYIGGEQVFRCGDCLDSGMILVWHQRSMQAVRDGTFGGRLTRYSCGVKCTCPAGEKWRHIEHAFDPKLMVPCDYHPSPEDHEALRQFVGRENAGREWNPDGYGRSKERYGNHSLHGVRSAGGATAAEASRGAVRGPSVRAELHADQGAGERLQGGRAVGGGY